MKSFSIKQSITNRDRDSVNLYLKDISHVKMLTPEEEKEVAFKAKAGDKRARDQLIASNTRFVVSVAKQYQGQGLDLEDLIAEGNAGLVRAADKFEPERGYKFISYAVWWIRQSIMQALSDKSRTIRLPVSHLQVYNKIRKAIAEFMNENEREPSLAELEELTGIPESKIITIINANNKMVSVDSPLKEEDDSTFVDIIPNQNIPKTDANIIKESKDKEMREILKELSPRSHDIIRMYFGIECSPLTLEQIGDRFGVHSERVRQIKEESLNIIKDKVKKYLK